MNEHSNPIKFRIGVEMLHDSLLTLRLALPKFLVACDDLMSPKPNYHKAVNNVIMAKSEVLNDKILYFIDQIVFHIKLFDHTTIRRLCSHESYHCKKNNPDHSDLAKLAKECREYYDEIYFAFLFASYNPYISAGIGIVYSEQIKHIYRLIDNITCFRHIDKKNNYCVIPQFPPRGALTKPVACHEYDE